MKTIIAAILAVPMLVASISSAQEVPQTQLQRTTLSVGIHRIETQVAVTSEQREIGLMYRKEMPQHEGMLFVFEDPSRLCFWMKNTLIPLTAAFIADDGTIVNLENMKPQTLDSHCSAKQVRYVLEMNLGWFAKKGLKPGSKVTGRPFSP
jgi:uncharacterized membrane protein (UPF0127 family)